MEEDFINNYLIQPFFFGFGIVTFILIYFQIMLKINTEKFIDSSINIIKYSGIIFLVIWCCYLIKDENLINRFKGKYWFAGWFLMFTYPVLSQLFWINKVRNSNLLIYVISILFIISNVIFSGKIVCFDGDCDMNYFFIGMIKEICIYILILLIVTYILKNKTLKVSKTWYVQKNEK